MTSVTYDDISDLKTELIRKALQGSVFIAPSTAALVTSITGTNPDSGLQALPTDYEDLGIVDQSNGVDWTRKTGTDDQDGWGFVEAVRSDINSIESTLKCTALETKRTVLELYYGLDLSAVTPNATTGEVTFEEPPRPATRYFRCLGLFVDGVGADAIYIGRFLPRASITDLDDQKWTNKGSTVAYGVTIQGYHDTDAGFAVQHFFGGPGWKALATKHGF